MFIEAFNTEGAQDDLISTTYYTYNAVGNVTRVTIERESPDPDERKFTATRFIYARNGAAVSYVIGEAWDIPAAGETGSDAFDIVYGREFRYDGARARYLVRELDTEQLELGNVVSLSEIWSDYDGDSIYGDFTLAGATLTQTAIYEPGIGRSFAPSDGFGTQYYHADAIGTTRMLTNTTSPPSVSGESSYTAFGEQIGGTSQRYGYAGAWGYQTATSDTPGDAYAADFKFMHVGARYYDPATGRFLQRDPIGIRGGLNVYAYVKNLPTVYVDPSGKIIPILIVTGIAAAVKLAETIINMQNAAEIVDADNPDYEPTIDQLIDDLQNREEKIEKLGGAAACLAEKTPGTSITGPPAPPTDVAGGILDVAGGVAGL